jgi:hypothetical protein
MKWAEYETMYVTITPITIKGRRVISQLYQFKENETVFWCTTQKMCKFPTLTRLEFGNCKMHCADWFKNKLQSATHLFITIFCKKLWLFSTLQFEATTVTYDCRIR